MGLHEKFGYPSKKQNKKYMQASVKKLFWQSWNRISIFTL